jgi:hypothetical protein
MSYSVVAGADSVQTSNQNSKNTHKQISHADSFDATRNAVCGGAALVVPHWVVPHWSFIFQHLTAAPPVVL